MTEGGDIRISAAMQELVVDPGILHRIYHEAPNDIFELFVRLSSELNSNGCRKGGLNVLRRVSKRCLRVVETVATRLTDHGIVYHLPAAALKRCQGIKNLSCYSLLSFNGCPDGLKSIYVGDGHLLQGLEHLSACKELETLKIDHASRTSDLSSLSSCTKMRKLTIWRSGVADLSPLSSMKLLEELDLEGSTLVQGRTPIEDLSPVSDLPRLAKLNVSYLFQIKDLSFFEKGFTKLTSLNLSNTSVDDLSPLTKLQNLEELISRGIPYQTCLVPLFKCYKLKNLAVTHGAHSDVEELREKRPDLQIQLFSY